MFKTLLGSAAVSAILILAMAAPAAIVKAQQAEQPPAAADPEANGEELSDEEIRQLIADESLERFGHWKRRRGFHGPRECSDYDGVDGPTRPDDVYCSPEDVPNEQVDLYRERKQQEESTFINEPQIKF